MINLGVVQQDSTITLPISHNIGTGAAGSFSTPLVVGDVDIYDVSGAINLTQRTSTAGFAVDDTFDAVTGLSAFTIDLSDNTDAGFYAAGNSYAVSLTPAGTIDSVTVAAWIGYFTIESNAQKAQRLLTAGFMPTHTPTAFTGNTTGLVNLTGILDSSATADDINGEVLAIQYVTGTYDGLIIQVRVTDYAVTNQLASVQMLDGTALPEAVASGDYVFRVGQFTSDVISVLGTAQTAGDIPALVQTADTAIDAVATTIGAAGAGLTAINLPNQTMDITGNLSGSVGSVTGAVGSVTGAVGSVTGAVGSVTATVSTTMNNPLTAAQVNTEADTALSDIGLHQLVSAASTANPVTNSYLGRGYNATTGGLYSRATDSLEAIRNRGDAAWTGGTTLTAAGITTAVWASTAQGKPTNYSALSITTAGAVTAGTVGDKTGYSLSQSFPTNFANLSLTTGGSVTAGTVSDKTGYAVSSTGLGAVTLAAPTGPITWGTVKLTEGLAYTAAFNKDQVVSNSTAIKLHNSTGGVIATAAVTATTSSVTRANYTT